MSASADMQELLRELAAAEDVESKAALQQQVYALANEALQSDGKLARQLGPRFRLDLSPGTTRTMTRTLT